jgi:uncharacterized membrane protein
MKPAKTIFLFIATAASLLLPAKYGFTQENTGGGDDGPDRSIAMAAQYTGIRVSRGKIVHTDLVFINRGRQGEHVSVWVSRAPQGWDTHIASANYEVTGLFVPAHAEKTLTFSAVPGERVGPGKYLFRIAARTKDGRFSMEEKVTVEVKQEKTQGESTGNVKLTAYYPVLKGPVKGEYEFSVVVKSELHRDAVFRLLATAPEGWTVSFQPAYESKLKARYISSLEIGANQSKVLDVEVKPALSAAAGEYPLKVRVSTEGAEAETDLKLILVGTYALKLGTPSGLLSLDARPGESSNISLYVKNTGTVVNRDISFTVFKPENWKIVFKPDRIDAIKPNDIKQVEAVITPYEEALVGDYSLKVQAKGAEGSQDAVEFRVTVKASQVWGWAGIGIIALVIVGLILTFRFLGRR